MFNIHFTATSKATARINASSSNFAKVHIPGMPEDVTVLCAKGASIAGIKAPAMVAVSSNQEFITANDGDDHFILIDRKVIKMSPKNAMANIMFALALVKDIDLWANDVLAAIGVPATTGMMAYNEITATEPIVEARYAVAGFCGNRAAKKAARKHVAKAMHSTGTIAKAVAKKGSKAAAVGFFDKDYKADAKADGKSLKKSNKAAAKTATNLVAAIVNAAPAANSDPLEEAAEHVEAEVVNTAPTAAPAAAGC